MIGISPTKYKGGIPHVARDRADAAETVSPGGGLQLVGGLLTVMGLVIRRLSQFLLFSKLWEETSHIRLLSELQVINLSTQYLKLVCCVYSKDGTFFMQ